MTLAFIVFCFFVLDTKARRSPCLWLAGDLELGGVQPQPHALGLGVGEHVLQGPHPHTRPLRNGEAPPGQQPDHLTDRAGHGGAVQSAGDHA
ncbi:hypothetical protein [Streptomyces sp. NPDC096013]|uniref:hypothetical protein n=1 Tax=Streptomyces sp. NPDC096013 TaxID=3366069 RepID=UPI0038162C97